MQAWTMTRSLCKTGQRTSHALSCDIVYRQRVRCLCHRYGGYGQKSLGLRPRLFHHEQSQQKLKLKVLYSFLNG